MELTKRGGQLVGPETRRLTAPATALGAVDTRAFATCCLQHLQHGHALARGQRRWIDPQSAATPLFTMRSSRPTPSNGEIFRDSSASMYVSSRWRMSAS